MLLDLDAHTLGCTAIHWSIVKLSGSTPLEKSDLPSPWSYKITNSFLTKSGNSCPPPLCMLAFCLAWVYARLVRAITTAGISCTTSLLCLENTKPPGSDYTETMLPGYVCPKQLHCALYPYSFYIVLEGLALLIWGPLVAHNFLYFSFLIKEVLEDRDLVHPHTLQSKLVEVLCYSVTLTSHYHVN